jgi:hypothetical protein
MPAFSGRLHDRRTADLAVLHTLFHMDDFHLSVDERMTLVSGVGSDLLRPGRLEIQAGQEPPEGQGRALVMRLILPHSPFYGTRKALDDMSFSVPPASFVRGGPKWSQAPRVSRSGATGPALLSISAPASQESLHCQHRLS